MTPMKNTALVMNVRKKIVTDENHQPVAVQIDYDDWLRIARVLDLETKPPAKKEQSSLVELADAAAPYWQGGDGLEYQRRIRAEWARPWDPEQEDDPETT
jgi:hypothetical protein